jgi:hypothetical protein
MPPSLYDGPGPGTYILPSTIGQDVERKGPPSFSMGVKTKGGGFLDHVGAANLPGPAQYHLPPTTFDSPAKTMGPKLTLPTRTFYLSSMSMIVNRRQWLSLPAGRGNWS